MKQNLDECFRYLHKPSIDKSPPLQCYHEIKFSDEEGEELPQSMEYYEILSRLLKVSLLDIRLDALRDGRLFVPFKLEELIKETKDRYVMIPVELESKSNLGNGGGGFYALLYDKNSKTMEFFRLPGTRLDDDLYNLEKKMVDLFENKYKFPVLQFYQAIRYEPKRGTRDYETWPAWLAYKRIKKNGIDREVATNYAMEDIVKNTSEYRNFVKAFYH